LAARPAASSDRKKHHSTDLENLEEESSEFRVSGPWAVNDGFSAATGGAPLGGWYKVSG